MKKIIKTLLPIVSIGSLAGCMLPITSCNKKSIDPADIAGIVVTSKPAKLTYAQGEYLDLTGLEVKIITKGGEKTVTTDYTSSIVDKTRLTEKGEKEITIKLNGTNHADTFKINVGEPVITKLEITNQPTNRVYEQNEALDLSGMVVKATSSMDIVTENFTDYTAEPKDGSVLTKWGRNTITLRADNATVTTDVLVTTESVKFSEASWEVVSDWTYCLEAGIATEAAFCDHFINENGTKFTSLSEFIGAEKKVTINGKEHSVKVIGINHDTIDSPEYFPEGKTTATFTFQFFNKITQKSAAASLGTLYDGNGTPDYINSQVRYNLDKRGDQTKSIAWDDDSVKTSLFEMLPAEFENYVWPVKKEVATKPLGQSSYTVKNYTDRLFLPTLTEYGQTTSPSQGRIFIKEGESYEYWLSHTSSTDRIISIAGAGTEKQPPSYYIATISIDKDLQKDDPLAFAIGGTDGVIGSFNIGKDTNHAIAPCFCI